jgi:hypothetical protein
MRTDDFSGVSAVLEGAFGNESAIERGTTQRVNRALVRLQDSASLHALIRHTIRLDRGRRDTGEPATRRSQSRLPEDSKTTGLKDDGLQGAVGSARG